MELFIDKMQVLLRHVIPITSHCAILCDCRNALFASVCSKAFSSQVFRFGINIDRDTRTKTMAGSHAKFNAVSKQKFDYFLVLDFEATCDNKSKLIPQVNITFIYN